MSHHESEPDEEQEEEEEGDDMSLNVSTINGAIDDETEDKIGTHEKLANKAPVPVYQQPQRQQQKAKYLRPQIQDAVTPKFSLNRGQKPVIGKLFTPSVLALLEIESLSRTPEELLIIKQKLMDVLRLEDYEEWHILEIARIAQVRHVPANTVLQQKQRRGTGFYLIINGTVSFEEAEMLSFHEYKSTRKLVSGDCFGESTMFNPYDESSRLVITQTRATLLVIRHDDFEPIQRAAVQSRVEERLKVVIDAFRCSTPIPQAEHSRIANYFKGLVRFANSKIPVYIQDDYPDYFYLIKTGKCDVVRYVVLRGITGHLESRIVHIDSLQNGAYFGELDLINGSPYSVTVLPNGPLQCYIMTPRDFHECFQLRAGTLAMKMLEVGVCPIQQMMC